MSELFSGQHNEMVAGGEASAFATLVQEVKSREGEHVSLAFKPVPPFSELLHESEAGLRTDRIRYRPSYVDSQGRWMTEPYLVETTEGGMLLQLDQFLEGGAIAARSAGDEEAAHRAKQSRETLAFLGNKEFQEAIAGIAQYWRSFIEAHPDNKIAVFSPQLVRGTEKKSADFVADTVVDHLQGLDPSLRERIVMLGVDHSELEGAEPDHTKLVVMDDWTSSGWMLRSDARQFANDLRLSGHGYLISKIEANLLVARREQVEQRTTFISNDKTGERQELPIVAYYGAPARDEGMYIFGAHSSVDHNDAFLRLLAELQQSMRGGGHVDLPPAALIHKPYNRNGEQ